MRQKTFTYEVQCELKGQSGFRIFRVTATSREAARQEGIRRAGRDLVPGAPVSVEILL